jgi:hypothetical protein
VVATSWQEQCQNTRFRLMAGSSLLCSKIKKGILADAFLIFDF